MKTRKGLQLTKVWDTLRLWLLGGVESHVSVFDRRREWEEGGRLELLPLMMSLSVSQERECCYAKVCGIIKNGEETFFAKAFGGNRGQSSFLHLQ